MTGTQLNGLDEGAAYGDDNEMSSNYPIVRVRDDANGNIYYARSYDWSSTGVATGSATETVDFDLPAQLGSDPYEVQAVANGIQSAYVPPLLNPSLSINSISATEGSDPVNTKPFNFTISLSQPLASPVTVHYTTSDGTASVFDHDYLPTSGILTFAPGQTTQVISVPVIGDNKVEPDETFYVDLAGASSNATLANTQGIATIKNDDPGQANIYISSVSKAEGNTGSTQFAFNVILDRAASSNVIVKYSTADGTAIAGSDYTAASGTITFTPGQTSKIITINVKGDTTQEPDEVFFLNLSNATNAQIVGSQGRGTIRNDDSLSSLKVQLVTDPADSTKKALEIWGTAGNDTIAVQNTGNSQGIAKIIINGANKGTFSFSGSIIVFGQDGNDNISINSSITRTAYLFGGGGNDTLSGGSGNDVLMGDDGNNTLSGNGGNDILIGGFGDNLLSGGAGDDVLVPEALNSTPSFSNLASLLKEWTRTDIPYTARVHDLENAAGFSKIAIKNRTVVPSYYIVTGMSGGSGNDWFLSESSDYITDKAASEAVLYY